MARTCTIYGMRSRKQSTYIYVGSTVSKDRRMYQHMRDVRRGEHCNQGFATAVISVGEKNMVCDVIEIVSDEAMREAREYFWIRHFMALGHPLTNIVLSVEQDRYVRKYRKVLKGAELVLDTIKLMARLVVRDYLNHRPLFLQKLRGAEIIERQVDDFATGVDRENILQYCQFIKFLFQVNEKGCTEFHGTRLVLI